jgi:transcription elongation factor Elf1
MEVRWDNADPANMDQDERLALAEALLTTIKANLNIAVTTCSSCGTDHKEDWDEFMAGQAIEGAITRIKKAKHLLDVSVEKRRYGVKTAAELKVAKNEEEKDVHDRTIGS